MIVGVQDEIYPCKPEIFEKTYEPVRERQTISADEVGAMPDGLVGKDWK